MQSHTHHHHHHHYHHRHYRFAGYTQAEHAAYKARHGGRCPTKPCPCPLGTECGERFTVCWGAKRRPYLRHETGPAGTPPCRSGMTPEHRNAQVNLCWLLNSATATTTAAVVRVRYTECCGRSEWGGHCPYGSGARREYAVSLQPGKEEAVAECPLGDGSRRRADVAVRDTQEDANNDNNNNNKSPRVVFEVLETHRTDEASRPQDMCWFEVKASDVNQHFLSDVNGSGNGSKKRRRQENEEELVLECQRTGRLCLWCREAASAASGATTSTTTTLAVGWLHPSSSSRKRRKRCVVGAGGTVWPRFPYEDWLERLFCWQAWYGESVAVWRENVALEAQRRARRELDDQRAERLAKAAALKKAFVDKQQKDEERRARIERAAKLQAAFHKQSHWRRIAQYYNPVSDRVYFNNGASDHPKLNSAYRHSRCAWDEKRRRWYIPAGTPLWPYAAWLDKPWCMCGKPCFFTQCGDMLVCYNDECGIEFPDDALEHSRAAFFGARSITHADAELSRLITNAGVK